MEKKLLYYSVVGIIFTAVLGTFFHFIYEWSGNQMIVGLISPVNESVWEHMKMLFFPMLFYTIIENYKLKEYFPGIQCANAAGILAGTLLIPVIFYTYSGILGGNHLIMDILTFYISIIAAFLISYYLSKKTGTITHCFLLQSLVVIFLVCFLVFTYYPPNIGLFISPEG